jgi:hypothetical protein
MRLGVSRLVDRTIPDRLKARPLKGGRSGGILQCAGADLTG